MSSIYRPAYQALLARVRAARDAAGLTQQQAADALSRSQSWISRVESGQTKLDPLELVDLAHLYRVPVSTLLGLR